jgi:hypothetical protein
MTLDFRRIYTHAVLGALGGLVGWTLTIPLAWFQATGTFRLLLKDALVGALVGLAVGAVIGAYDGLFSSRSFGRLLKGVFLGGLVGTFGGVVGLALGEVIFILGGGGAWPRALGWTFFGLLVGASQGIGQWSLAKVGYGILGGLLGGLVGGSTCERLSALLQMVTHQRELGLSIGGAMGLIILGAAIGGFIGLVEVILRTAWLRFTRGKLEGQTVTLDPRKRVQILGRAPDCAVVIPGDVDVQPHHAAILREDSAFVIEPRDGSVLLRGLQGYAPVESHALRHRDRIQVGKTRFTFMSEQEEEAS